MSLAGIEQLQEMVAEFDSADKFDDEWFIQQLHAENLLLDFKLYRKRIVGTMTTQCEREEAPRARRPEILQNS